MHPMSFSGDVAESNSSIWSWFQYAFTILWCYYARLYIIFVFVYIPLCNLHDMCSRVCFQLQAMVLVMLGVGWHVCPLLSIITNCLWDCQDNTAMTDSIPTHSIAVGLSRLACVKVALMCNYSAGKWSHTYYLGHFSPTHLRVCDRLCWLEWEWKSVSSGRQVRKCCCLAPVGAVHYNSITLYFFQCLIT